jgi:hypothetical protein
MRVLWRRWRQARREVSALQRWDAQVQQEAAERDEQSGEERRPDSTPKQLTGDEVVVVDVKCRQARAYFSYLAAYLHRQPGRES